MRELFIELVVANRLVVLLKSMRTHRLVCHSPTPRALLTCAYVTVPAVTIRFLLQVMAATFMYNSKPVQKSPEPAYELVPQNKYDLPGAKASDSV